MTVTLRFLIAVLAGSAAGATPVAVGDVSAVGETACGGVVFRDLDADGRRVETLEHDLRPDDIERGVGAMVVDVVDRQGDQHRTRTNGSGEWFVDIAADDYPVRIEFRPPSGFAAGHPGPDAGRTIQFAASPADCDGRPVGNLGVYPIDDYCASRPEFAVPCYVVADHPTYDDQPAIRAVSNAAVDDGDTAAESIDDWLRPVTRVIATNGDVGAVYGQAAARDGTIFAAAFTKRHTRLTTELNPTGNPTTIYSVAPGGRVTVLTVLDPTARDPHQRRAADDLDAMDAVFISGIGDIELSSDGETLYAVDLGNRELAIVDAGTGDVRRRVALDGPSLGRTDCAVTPNDPFGDLRAFGLGWRNEALLVGVVCSAASSVDPGRPVPDDATPGTAGGDHGQLRGHVFEYVRGHFTELLDWPLAADRGETQDNGLTSNDAFWHPWVPAYPFDDEHDVVSYPQPAITDLVVDDRGDLVIAIGDRWAHQTAPMRNAPAWDGTTRLITEPIAAGDLQRACRRGRGWVIEGSEDCDGGFGNGWEFFDGDSYGWHAETALGSVARLPGRAEVVATQMDPKPDDEMWHSGGLAWHGTEVGDYRHGVRLYDGRSAEPDHTFEHASGLGDLAVLCGGPTPSVGGTVWHDLNADGIRDPGDGPVGGAVIELRDEAGDVLSTEVTDADGGYAFDDGNIVGGLDPDAVYVVTMAARNRDPNRGVLAGTGPHTGLVPTAAHRGERDDLDSDAVLGAAGTRYQGQAVIGIWSADDPNADADRPVIEHSYDFGLRDRYDLAISTTQGERTKEPGIVSFRIEVHNEGSLPSGPFEVTANLPVETSLRQLERQPSVDVSVDAGSVTWTFGAAAQVRPGDVRVVEMDLWVNDPTVASVSNRVAIVADGGVDEDSDPGRSLREDDEDELTIELFGLAGRVWVDTQTDDTKIDDAERVERGLGGLVVYVLDQSGERVGGTTTDDAGRFLFDSFPAGTYRIAIPAAEFESGRPLHHYDRAVGSELGDVGRMLADVGMVRSTDVNLGPNADADAATSIELGLTRQPPRPFVDVVVTRMLMPLLVACGALLLVDRRRRLGYLVPVRS